MIEPKISIVTPSFNQGQYIEQTIDSVLSQNYPNLEYIIVDGGSTDQSVEIIKKHKKHLAYWVSEKDEGQSDAINKGFGKATGEIINWINSDDYYEPHALRCVAEAFGDEETQVVCGRSRLFQNRDETVSYSRGTDIYANNLAKTIGWARVDQPETFFRRSLLNRVGSINPALHYVMDKELWIRYLFSFGLQGIREIDNTLVNFRLHESSKTVSQSEAFEQETDTMFMGIAKQFGCDTEATAIQRTANCPENKFSTDFVSISIESITAALHYYLLYKADLFYYGHQRKLAAFCLKAVDRNLLERADQQLFDRLYFKNKMFPVFVTKLFRK